MLGDSFHSVLVFPKQLFLGKGPRGSARPAWCFSAPRNTIPSFIRCLVVSWVDLKVDWKTQLVCYASLWQKDAMVESFARVLQWREDQPWPTFCRGIDLAVAGRST